MIKWLLPIFFLIVVYNGCSKNPFGESSTNQTETGNPITGKVNIEFSDYTTQKVTTAAVSSVTMCFKRMRFKSSDENSEDADDFDIEIGQIVINSTGTLITDVDVPEGNYDRIEFDLEANCEGASAPSVIVDNDNDGGTPFTTNDDIRIRFEGNFTVDRGGDNLVLNIGNIINAMDTVTNESQIEDLLEDISAVGSIDDDD